MKNTTLVERTSEREMVTKRTFNAPAHIVFEAWTSPDIIKRWWLPESFGMSFEECEIDARTGGKYRFVFNHPDFEKPMAFFGKYLEVTPHSRLIWTNEEGAEGPVTTVTFDEKNGSTLLVLSELYPSKQALDDAIAAGSVSADAATAQFDLLDEFLAA